MCRGLRSSVTYGIGTVSDIPDQPYDLYSSMIAQGRSIIMLAIDTLISSILVSCRLARREATSLCFLRILCPNCATCRYLTFDLLILKRRASELHDPNEPSAKITILQDLPCSSHSPCPYTDRQTDGVTVWLVVHYATGHDGCIT